MRGETMLLLIVTVLSVFPLSVRAGKRSEERRHGKFPRFIPTEHNVSASSGGEALLPCAVDGLTGRYTVIWMKHKGEIPNPLFVGVDQVTSDERFRLIHEGSVGTAWNLQLSPVKVSDEGFYECQVNTEKPMRHKVFLHVPLHPTTTTHLPAAYVYLDPTEVIMEQGSALTLQCNGSHSPLEWYKDGAKIDTSGSGAVITAFVQEGERAYSQLIIDRLRIRDAGTYVCRGGGIARSATVHVLTEKAPEAVKSAACTPLPTITAIFLLSTRWLQGMKS